jgi:hypothetical protein
MTDEKPLLQHLFGKSTLAGVEEDSLRQMSREYPFFPHVYWMLASRSAGGDKAAGDLRRAATYAFHPLRLLQYLPPDADGGAAAGSPAAEALPATNAPEPAPRSTPEPAADAPPAEETQVADETVTTGLAGGEDGGLSPAPPLIQPLFTRDYFAYTGARLPEHIENDKRPTMEQLHSFTDWLRTLKRPKGAPDPDLQKDEASRAAREESEHAGIRKSAEASVKTSHEVDTEAMAEVRAARGENARAIAIYKKLSLSNPEKNAYFAQKIEALKNK